MPIQAYRIEWSGIGDDKLKGYSLHRTYEDAAAYLLDQEEALPDEVRAFLSQPGKGWKNPVMATPVEIPAGSKMAKALKEKPSVYFLPLEGSRRELTAIRDLKATGEPVQISFRVPYTPGQRKQIEKRRAGNLLNIMASLPHLSHG